MTRAAQALLARALGVPAGTALPSYVQRRAQELDSYLQSRLPPEHPVVVAHAAAIIAAWRSLKGAGAMGTAAGALYASMGQDAPTPSASTRSTQSNTVWRLLSNAMQGIPSAERLPDSMLARCAELDALLRDSRLPEEHPFVQAHVAGIVVDSQATDAGWLARRAAQALKAWQAEQEQRQTALEAQALELQKQGRLLESTRAEICQREATLEEQTKKLAQQQAEQRRALDARKKALDKREATLARPVWKRWWDALVDALQ